MPSFVLLWFIQAASGHEAKVRISKEVHPKIIGKGGAQIRKIREETDTKIDFPRENSVNDIITITGKKENVEKAKNMIEAIEKETVLLFSSLQLIAINSLADYVNIYHFSCNQRSDT